MLNIIGLIQANVKHCMLDSG